MRDRLEDVLLCLVVGVLLLFYVCLIFGGLASIVLSIILLTYNGLYGYTVFPLLALAYIIGYMFTHE